jgi:hypothetical protein
MVDHNVRPSDRAKAHDELRERAKKAVVSDSHNSEGIAYSAVLLSDLLITSVESNATQQECRRQIEALHDFVSCFEIDDPAYDEVLSHLGRLDNQLESLAEAPIDRERKDELVRVTKRVRDLYVRSF